jgi:hypothetical protein
MLSYYQVWPRDLSGFYKYLLDYPNAKPANVETMFYSEKVNFGLKPTLPHCPSPDHARRQTRSAALCDC